MNVRISIKSDLAQQARDLLGAATHLGHDRTVVKYTPRGFWVPEDVAREYLGVPEEKPKPKKRAAKKRAAKKRTSQKADGDDKTQVEDDLIGDSNEDAEADSTPADSENNKDQEA